VGWAGVFKRMKSTDETILRTIAAGSPGSSGCDGAQQLGGEAAGGYIYIYIIINNNNNNNNNNNIIIYNIIRGRG
jgi:hypothetical protein